MTRKRVLISKPWTIAVAAVASALTFTSAPAQEADIGISAPATLNEAPGSTFGVTFDFDFHSPGSTTVSIFNYTLQYDPSQLSMDPTQLSSILTATGQFTPFGTDAALNAQTATSGTYSIVPTGPAPASGPLAGEAPSGDNLQYLTALWYDFNAFVPNPVYTPLTPSGTTSVTYLFTLAATATPGTTTDVTLTLSYYDAEGGAHPADGSDFVVPVEIDVTAVPLPASGLLMSVAFAAIGAFLRRRAPRPS